MRRHSTQSRSNKSAAHKLGGMSLDGFITDIYLPHARLRKRSWELDERISRRYISPAFGHMPLSEITHADVEDWHNRLLEAGFAAASCNRFLALLKTIFALAERRCQIHPDSSPCRDIHPFKIRDFRERYLSRMEGTSLMKWLAKSTDLRARAIELILLTGARKNEILKARWEWINTEQRTIRVPLSKSGRVRYIILSDAALAILGRIPRQAGRSWLFPGRKPDKPISDLFTFWNRTRRETGLGDMRIHDLRHSYASFLVNSGHSLYEVQKLLGHSDPRTTMRYAHLSQNALVAATQAVGEIIAG